MQAARAFAPLLESGSVQECEHASQASTPFRAPPGLEEMRCEPPSPPPGLPIPEGMFLAPPPGLSGLCCPNLPTCDSELSTTASECSGSTCDEQEVGRADPRKTDAPAAQDPEQKSSKQLSADAPTFVPSKRCTCGSILLSDANFCGDCGTPCGPVSAPSTGMQYFAPSQVYGYPARSTWGIADMERDAFAYRSMAAQLRVAAANALENQAAQLRAAAKLMKADSRNGPSGADAASVRKPRASASLASTDGGSSDATSCGYDSEANQDAVAL